MGNRYHCKWITLLAPCVDEGFLVLGEEQYGMRA